jgi:hypothetical protein
MHAEGWGILARIEAEQVQEDERFEQAAEVARAEQPRDRAVGPTARTEHDGTRLTRPQWFGGGFCECQDLSGVAKGVHR